MCGDKYDDERFEVLAEDGLVEKEMLLMGFEAEEGAEVGAGYGAEASGLPTKESAEADSQADM